MSLTFRLTALLVLLVTAAGHVSAAQMTSTATPEDYAQSSYEQAIRLRGEGQLIEAERLIHEALSEFPENQYYQFELSNVYAAKHDVLQRRRRNSEAREMLRAVAVALEQAVMLDESYVPAQYNLGVVYKRLGEYERAREKMRSLIAYAESSGQPNVVVNAWLQIGSIYEEQGFFYEAREAYLTAKDLNYNNPNIEGALRDLDRRERQKKLSMQRQAGIDMYQRRLEMNSIGRIGSLNQYQDQSASAAAALPFLGMALIQQFLDRNARNSEE